MGELSVIEEALMATYRDAVALNPHLKALGTASSPFRVTL